MRLLRVGFNYESYFNETHPNYTDIHVSIGYCNAEYLCDTGELRLVNGSGGMVNNNGRLEFCRNGVWGTVSDYEFDMADARVACRKLGFNPDGAGMGNIIVY